MRGRNVGGEMEERIWEKKRMGGGIRKEDYGARDRGKMGYRIREISERRYCMLGGGLC